VQVLKALEAAATSQKAATKRRNDKVCHKISSSFHQAHAPVSFLQIEWTSTWKRLVDDEVRLDAQLRTCTAASQLLNSDTGGGDGHANEDDAIGADAVQIQAELEYDRTLLRQRLRSLVSNVRHFVGDYAHGEAIIPDIGTRLPLQRVRIQLDAAQDALWELKEQLLLQENDLEEICRASQADVAKAVVETANANTVRRTMSVGPLTGSVHTSDVPGEAQARWEAFVKHVGIELSSVPLAKLDCFDQYQEMVQHYVDELLQLDRWFATESAAMGVPDSSDGAGGWPPDAHSAYLHVFFPTRRAPKTRPINDVIAELLAILSVMNGGTSPYNREDVLRHHHFCTVRRQFHERIEVKRAQFDREMAGAVNHWKAQIQDAKRAQSDLQRQELERKSHEIARREAHARLAAARKRKEAEDAIAREIARDLFEAESAVEEARKERLAAETLLKKSALETYHNEQATLQSRLDAVEAQKNALLAAEQQQAKVVHASRVAFRKEVAAERGRCPRAVGVPGGRVGAT
jgi:hypothetical protein